jgi:hypothetical protein
MPLLISSAEALRFKSMMSAQPPRLSTRDISFNASTGLAKFLKAARQSRKSKLAVGNGRLDAEPCWKLTATPASAAFFEAIFTMEWLMSTPVMA